MQHCMLSEIRAEELALQKTITYLDGRGKNLDSCGLCQEHLDAIAMTVPDHHTGDADTTGFTVDTKPKNLYLATHGLVWDHWPSTQPCCETPPQAQRINQKQICQGITANSASPTRSG